jgi:hypothetical protein
MMCSFLTAYIDQSKSDNLDHDGQHLLEDVAVTKDRRWGNWWGRWLVADTRRTARPNANVRLLHVRDRTQMIHRNVAVGKYIFPIAHSRSGYNVDGAGSSHVIVDKTIVAHCQLGSGLHKHERRSLVAQTKKGANFWLGGQDLNAQAETINARLRTEVPEQAE